MTPQPGNETQTHKTAREKVRRPAVRCSARSSRTGNPCKAFAVHGTTVCRVHGGAARQVRQKSAQRVEKARAAIRVAEAVAEMEQRLGGRLLIEPLDALLDQVFEAAANVQALRAFVSVLGVGVERRETIAIPEQVIEFEKGGTHVPARLHVLVEFYNAERDRLTKYAKLCLDAGVEERRVRVAEADAQRFSQAYIGALDDIADKLTPEIRDALAQALGARLDALVLA